MKKPSHRKKSSHCKRPSTTKLRSVQPQGAAATQSTDLAARLQGDLAKLPLNQLARASGFVRRTPKKLTATLFVQAACLLVTLGSVSYRQWAALIGLLGQCTLTKQALFERMTQRSATFLQSVLQALLTTAGTASGTVVPPSLLSFGRVLLLDSTTLRLSEKLASLFPGPSNQRGAQGGMLKIQACYDLLSRSFVHFSLSSYRRNDQAASPDVLPLLKAGDLIVRDLGYFVLQVFEQITLAQAHFLSRLRLGVSIWQANGHTPVNLLALLRKKRQLDGNFCLGANKLPVRLVAIRLPVAIAAQRRRKARQDRDRRTPPSAQRLALLGWEIYITNVPRTVWSAQEVGRIYGLRWRIETIFKAWKSHFALTEVPAGSKAQVETVIYAKLIFITLFQICFWQRWLLGAHTDERPPLSLLKVAQGLQGFLLILMLNELGIDPELAWVQLIGTHCRYERRTRRHFAQNFHCSNGTSKPGQNK